jgi:hypothetical protein
MTRPQFGLKTLLWITALIGWCIVALPFWVPMCLKAYNEYLWKKDRPRREAAEKAEHDRFVKWKYGSEEEYQRQKRLSEEWRRMELKKLVEQAKSQDDKPQSSP